MANPTATLACTYAALILHDEGIDIQSNKIAALVKAAGVNIEAYWPKLIAEALKGRNISDFFGVGGGDAAPAQTAAPAKTEAPKKEEKKKEEPKKVEKPKEEEEFDGGMGDLFG